MAGTADAKLEVVPEEVTTDLDLDILSVSNGYTVMRGRTFVVHIGSTAHYSKVSIAEQILLGETEQDFRDRMDVLMDREAAAELAAITNWIREAGL